MSHSFSAGKFFTISELVAAVAADQPSGSCALDELSVCVIGRVQGYDHRRDVVRLEHAGSVLTVDVSLTGPCPFHVGWLFQFIGELEHCPGSLRLRARTATDKQRLDFPLYLKVVQRRRAFMAKLRTSVTPPRAPPPPPAPDDEAE